MVRSQRGFVFLAQASQVGFFSILRLFRKAASFLLHWQSQYNKSLLPTPLTPLAIAPGVKGSLALLGAAEFNR